ncbi:MAG TPA: aminotransferase class I/II-fold pyridoxal phosphate-dependent enzyme [Thermomicrobiales bacterium]|nr:aminotransferase class I/II-fold pyridoxal phosphate-dependent enzyme [Thermomicrobiales bacterium]
MSGQTVFGRTARLRETQAAFRRAITDPVFMRRFKEAGDDACDFTTGNPHEMPLSGYVEALQRAAEPHHPNWFAYGANQPVARAAVIESLLSRMGLPFEQADIYLTAGGAGAIDVGIKAVTSPGDEAIFCLPPWFFYEFMVVEAGLTPVKVPIDLSSFDLDLAAIEAAITPRTRLIIVNTPNNPTGRIYRPELLKDLALLLDEASRRHGREIYLLSDEVYNRIVFDGIEFHSPMEFYPNSMLAYSYGKTLLTPGDRNGYLAVSPHATHREALQESANLAQIACGASWSSRIHQHAIPDLEKLSIDIPAVERRRDRLVTELRGMGYEVHSPEGSFWLLPKSPWEDDWAFWQLLMEHNIFGAPGVVLEFPGFFRLSLSASDAMIDRSLPGFAAAIEHARSADPPAPAAQSAARR